VSWRETLWTEATGNVGSHGSVHWQENNYDDDENLFNISSYATN